MITELKEENEVLKETAIEQQSRISFTKDGFKEAEVQGQADALDEEKKKLEKELRAVENRIKHIMTENEEIEAEMTSYDQKAKKILEARAKKLEWEKKKAKELEIVEEAERKKREYLVIKAVERDNIISQRRGHFSKIQDQAMEEQREQMKMSKALKTKIDEYEMILREHKKLQSQTMLPSSKVDQLHRVQTEHREKKEKLTTKVKLESAAVSELDKKLEKLRELEQKMVQDKKASLNQKGQIKSHLQDIINKKLDENEIKELLAAREKPTKSPSGIRRKSIEKILKGDIQKATRAKSPGLPTKFIGGNIGSYTEMRNQTYVQRDGDGKEIKQSNLNQSINFQKQQKMLSGTRFASPQSRLTQNRPTTAASKVSSSTVGSFTSPATVAKNLAKNPARTSIATGSSRLSKPAVSKPSVVTAGRGAALKEAQKKDLQKQTVSKAAQKPVLRGRGTIKVLSTDNLSSDQGNLDKVEPLFEPDVQIESPQNEESISRDELSPSDNKQAHSTEDMTMPRDSQQDKDTLQHEGDLVSQTNESQEPRFELKEEDGDKQENHSNDINTKENDQSQEEGDHQEDLIPENSKTAPSKSKGSTPANKTKSPTLLGQSSKIGASKTKTGLKSPGISFKSSLTPKSGLGSKKY
jgi:hypothetical protein